MIDKTDPLYKKIESHVIKTKNASITVIQRNFGVGYNLGSQCINIMEKKGIVSVPREYGKRDVLV